MRYSFRKADLDQKLESLRKYNGDLLWLSDQTSKLRKQQSANCVRSRLTYNHGYATKFPLIRDASSKVYNALSKSCSKHTKHKTRFCLEAKIQDTEFVKSSQFQFRLAFTRQLSQSLDASGDLIFFIIESTTIEGGEKASTVASYEEGHIEALPATSSSPTLEARRSPTVNGLKRAIKEPEGTRKKIKPSVRFNVQRPSPHALSSRTRT